MNIAEEAQAIEKRCKSAKVRMGAVCALAGLDRTTFWRWKTGHQNPGAIEWYNFNKAAEKLLAQVEPAE